MHKYLGFSLVAVVGVCSLVAAQERGKPVDEGAPPAIRREAGVATPRAGWSTDQQIAAFLLGCARNEVAISRIAEEKATSEEVRNFAAQMVKEHTSCVEKLQQAAGPLASAHAPGTPAGAVRREVIKEVKEEVREPAPGTPRPARREPAEPRERVVEERTVVEIRAGGNAFDWNDIHKQLADQFLASAKAEFAKKSGAELDHCYMGQQIMGHAFLLDEIKVLRNYASPELRKDLDEASKTASRELDEAKKIAENLMKDSTERVSRKPKAE